MRRLLAVFNRHRVTVTTTAAIGLPLAILSALRIGSRELVTSVTLPAEQAVVVDTRTSSPFAPQRDMRLYRATLGLQVRTPEQVSNASTFLVTSSARVKSVSIFRVNYSSTSAPSLISTVKLPADRSATQQAAFAMEAETVADKLLRNVAALQLSVAGCDVQPDDPMPLDDEGRVTWSIRCSAAGNYSGVVSVVRSPEGSSADTKFDQSAVLELVGSSKPLGFVVSASKKRETLDLVLLFLGSFGTLPGMVTLYAAWKKRRENKRRAEQSPIIIVK
jgi:hypothetical protein